MWHWRITAVSAYAVSRARGVSLVWCCQPNTGHTPLITDNVECWIKEVAMLNEVEVAVLNREALDTLGALFGDEGPGAIVALIDEYLSELDHTLPQMDSAIEKQDSNSLYVLAHTLKSSSANMGAITV